MTSQARDCRQSNEPNAASRRAIAEAHEKVRTRNWRDAYEHWVGVGYSDLTARALAAVKHGQDEDVRAWALNIMRTKTNLRYEDML